MIPWIGDFAEDASVVHYFNTFDSNDPAASVTITNLVDADLKVHKDGSVTQIVTDGATIAIDFDSITGTHKVTIDTSAHADYAIGADYMVRMEGTTVDGGTINAALFTFSIENRFNEVNVVQLGGSTQSATDLKDFADAGYDPATNKVQGVVLTDTLTTYTGNTVQTGDSFARLGAPAGASVSADVADIPTVSEFNARTLAAAAYFDPAADTVANVTTVATLTGHTAQTGDSFARLGAPAGVSVSADILAIDNFVDGLESTIGTAGAGLTDLGGMSTAMKAEVNAEVLDVIDTDTHAEPAQGAPGATISLSDKISFLYKAWRNRSTQTATTYSLYNDDATTVDHKATVSDDATTADKGEVGTGP